MRDEQCDGGFHPVCQHTAHDVSPAGASKLKGFEDGGTSVHSLGHTWRRSTAPAAAVLEDAPPLLVN